MRHGVGFGGGVDTGERVCYRIWLSLVVVTRHFTTSERLGERQPAYRGKLTGEQPATAGDTLSGYFSVNCTRGCGWDWLIGGGFEILPSTMPASWVRGLWFTTYSRRRKNKRSDVFCQTRGALVPFGLASCFTKYDTVSVFECNTIC